MFIVRILHELDEVSVVGGEAAAVADDVPVPVQEVPVVIEATDTSTNKVYNAVRMTRKIIKRLNKIDNEPGNKDK